MSFIVKGIDLPKEGSLMIEIYPDGTASADLGNFYPDMIEAIQIPKKHGDIKDINTFLKDKCLTEYIENDVFNKKYSYSIGIGAIYNAPTILEAEE